MLHFFEKRKMDNLYLEVKNSSNSNRHRGMAMVTYLGGLEKHVIES